MSPSSYSDSDSDREPNSYGARVFWGNLKTPERSKSNYVDPPQTVVKTNKSQPQSFSTRDDLSDGENDAVRSDSGDVVGRPIPRSRGGNMIVQSESENMMLDVEPLESDAANHHAAERIMLHVSPEQSFLSTSVSMAQPSEANSRRAVEEDMVLQSSPTMNVIPPAEGNGAMQPSLNSPMLSPSWSNTTTGRRSSPRFVAATPPAQQTQAPLFPDASSPSFHRQPPDLQLATTRRSPSPRKSPIFTDNDTAQQPFSIQLQEHHPSRAISPKVVESSTSEETLSHKQMVQSRDIMSDAVMTTTVAMSVDSPEPHTNEGAQEQPSNYTDHEPSHSPEPRMRATAKLQVEINSLAINSSPGRSQSPADPSKGQKAESPSRSSPRLKHAVSQMQSTGILIEAKSPRTPARRVPVVTSPGPRNMPPLQLGRPNPVRLDDPNRTPARRIPIPSNLRPLPLESPERIPARRVPIVQPPPTRQTQTSAIRAEKRSVASYSVSSPAQSSIKPPFPRTVDPAKLDIAKASNVSASSSIPLDSGSQTRADAKSSRRLGSPPHKLPKVSSSRLPVPGPGLNLTTASVGSSRTQLPSSKPSRIPSPVKRRFPIVATSVSSPTVQSVSNMGTVERSSSSTLGSKRRRMMTEDAEFDEPPPKRHMTIVRRVTKGMFNKTGSKDTSASDTQGLPSLLKSSATVDARSSTPDPLDILTQSPTNRVPGQSSAAQVESSTETDTASTTTMPSRESTMDDIPVSSSFVLRPEPSLISLGEPAPELRRTKRVRKPSTPANKQEPPPPLTMMQLGASTSSKPSRSLTQSLKVQNLPMNQRQWQAVTQANTAHNQVYFADLQRKVIRKEGPRPPSPTSKVRTVLDKRKGDGAKGREARAERRRRRREGSDVSMTSEGESVDSSGNSSPPRRDYASEDAATAKYARGPGDEEDYETPARAPKPSRLYPGEISKNVKWDKGLARSLSDIAAEQAAQKEQNHDRAAVPSVRKGCLARNSQALRLDPLGNVPDANIPLANLDRERVIVTRIIYDDDEDMEATRVAKKKKS